MRSTLNSRSSKSGRRTWAHGLDLVGRSAAAKDVALVAEELIRARASRGSAKEAARLHAVGVPVGHADGVPTQQRLCAQSGVMKAIIH